MELDPQTLANLIKTVGPDVVEWIPSGPLKHISKLIAENVAPREVLASLGEGDATNPNFHYAEIISQAVSLAVVISSVYSGVAKTDTILGLVLDNDAKLIVAEKAILRLRQAGLVIPAKVVQGWVDKVLDQLTRPTFNR